MKTRPLSRGALPSTLVAALLFATASTMAAIPAEMTAARVDTAAAPGTLKLVTVPVPKPAAQQVLIEVRAASANPSDWGIRSGPPRALPPSLAAPAPPGAPPRVPMGERHPGNDAAGVVAAVGEGVTQFKVGDKVVAALQESGGGAYAQYALANIDRMALKPASFTYEQAAGIPTAGFTALRMVILGEVKQGQRVLVIGAAGGVGSTAVQAAKARGAYVITSASSRHDAYLKRLGADEIHAYDKVNIAEVVKDVDVVINTVGSENRAAMGYVKRGGRVINIGGETDAPACTAQGITCLSGGPQSGGPSVGELLQELVRMAHAGQFTVVIDKRFPLQAINDAYAYGRAGNREGKLAIVVRPDAAQR